jgi:hypothetical protein
MTRALLSMAVIALLAMPSMAPAQQSTGQQEVRQAIWDSYNYSKENMADAPGTYSSEGAREFWSSGGLLQVVPADSPLNEYDSFSLTPKHIRIMMLADDQVAVAHFYAEGAFKVKGQPAVTDYMTRATQVFVKENGAWKVRSSHFSPIMGGSGTPQRSVEN